MCVCVGGGGGGGGEREIMLNHKHVVFVAQSYQWMYESLLSFNLILHSTDFSKSHPWMD